MYERHAASILGYGGYPGAAPLVEDPQRWARYVRDSLIETTMTRTTRPPPIQTGAA